MTSFFKALNFGKSKHKKLPEDWGDSIKEPVNEGITFYVKSLGSVLVDEPSNDSATAEAIKTIIAMAKASGKKLPRVELTVKPTGIITKDSFSKEKQIDVSIYRISYCSADANYDRVVAFIATNQNETMECHAFLTSKRKIAQAAALTISQAFSIAYEKWKQRKETDDSSNKLNSKTEKALEEKTVLSEPLIDFSAEATLANGKHSDSNADDSFLKFMESRSGGSSTLLPSNLSIINFKEVNAFLEDGASEKDEKFYTDDNPDDLLLL